MREIACGRWEISFPTAIIIYNRFWKKNIGFIFSTICFVYQYVRLLHRSSKICARAFSDYVYMYLCEKRGLRVRGDLELYKNSLSKFEMIK